MEEVSRTLEEVACELVIAWIRTDQGNRIFGSFAGARGWFVRRGREADRGSL
jgi:hypothetical protein